MPAQTNDTAKLCVDKLGMHLEIVGWLDHKRQRRYLVRYSQLKIPNRLTYGLVEHSRVPLQLICDFQHSVGLNVSNKSN